MSRTFRQACRQGDKVGARRALERVGEPELAALVERIGGPRAMVRFLVQRRHVLDPEPVASTAAWVRDHLAEAEPIHLLDVGPALAAAEAREHGEIARRLRAHEQFLQPPDPTRWSRPVPSEEEAAFLDACRQGNEERAAAMLTSSSTLARSEDAHGDDAIAIAAAHGDAMAELVAALADAGARRSARTLGRVAARGSAALVEVLLERGYPLRGGIDDDALWIAAEATASGSGAPRFGEIAARLVEAGADPNRCDRWGVSAWGAANTEGREALERLGARAEPAGASTYDPETGMSATLTAIVAGDGGDADGLDLNEAAAAGNAARVSEWLDAAGQVPRLRRHGPPERPMHLAACMGHVEVIHLLIARGYSPAEINAPLAQGHHVGPPDTWGRTAVTVAAARGHGDAIYVLMNSVDFVQGRRARRK